MNFEWNLQKATNNWKKHKVSFDEAATVFCDNLSITYPDIDHLDQEERFIIIGLSNTSKVLVISHVYRGENIRIISARPVTKRERIFYECGKYAKQCNINAKLIMLEPDVAKIFHNAQAVNEALRALAKIIDQYKKVA